MLSSKHWSNHSQISKTIFSQPGWKKSCWHCWTRVLVTVAIHAWHFRMCAWIGLASAASQLDRNPWQRIATYKSGFKQTWRCIFFVWKHIEKAQTDRTPASPASTLLSSYSQVFLVFFLRVQIPSYILSFCASSLVRRAVSLMISVVPVQHCCLEEDPSRPSISLS